MVLPEIKITPPGVGIVPGNRNIAPRRSNQTPEGPLNPMPLLVSQFQGIPQQIKTWYPHTTPNVDNYQGIPQHIKTRIPSNLPPGAVPGNLIDELINPRGIKTVGYQIPQHIKTQIPTNLPPGVYPGSYGTRKMSYDGASTFLIGGIVGFIAGAIIFTAAGRNLARATVSRATTYIQPKS